MRRILSAALLACALSLPAGLLAPARAEDEKSYTLVIKDHKFEPTQLEVPANLKFKLIIKNLDSSAEEFEMASPKREKVVKGGQEGSIYLGPFNPGSYEFFGDYNPKTARGQIVVK